jgi:hypothetical protein
MLQATPISILPKDIRYIKLGDGGRWAEQSFSEGVVCFGYPTIPHEVCEREDWAEVRHLLSDRKSAGAMTAGLNEVRAFYEMGEDCLWFTFANGYLWWAFASPEVQWTGDGTSDGPSRKRVTVDGWHNSDIFGRSLRVIGLSSKLTKIQSYRATICKLADHDYLLRHINGVLEPIVVKAIEVRKVMTAITIKMMQGLDWADFETLADLIFSRSGWQRSTKVGENLTDIDIVMEQPTTKETAFVQVKSEATQAVLDDYLSRFRRSGYDRFFFVCHSPKGTLTLPEESRLHLFEGERLADAAVKSGLFDWLIERSG